jgi:uncharacterized iron-regulated protein
LVGESHDDAVGHGVEAQLLVRAAQRFGRMGDGDVEADRPVILSLEMFERDVQYILDEYRDGLITEDQFLENTRPWDNYQTDYRPMVEFAVAHGLPVVAANAPRRYVNRVTRLGPESLEELSDEARRYLPPLPYPGPSEAYRKQWDRVMAEMMEEAMAAADSAHQAMDSIPAHQAMDSVPAHQAMDSVPAHDVPDEAESPPAHSMDNALQSQALWDAAMGEAVAGALESHPGGLVIHYAGSFHVARHTGIPERVADYRPGARVLTVVLRPVEDIRAWDDEELGGLGDFVVLTRKPGSGSPHETNE